MLKSNFFYLCIVITITVVTTATTVNAQFLWHLTLSNQLKGTTGVYDSLFEYSSISCFGNTCTIGAYVTDTSTYPWKGANFFFHSTDGGTTWFTQVPNVKFPKTFKTWGFIKIQQIDSLNIVSIGDSGFVIRTFDGGVTWEAQHCPTTQRLFDIHFSNPMTGIACSPQDGLFTTFDGGQNWMSIPDKRIFPYRCFSYGGQVFRLTTYGNNRTYKTTDNFVTLDTVEPIWDSSIHPLLQSYLSPFCNMSGDTIFRFGKLMDTGVLSGSGLTLKSTDGGRHWLPPTIFNKLIQISNLSSIDRDTIVASGISGGHIAFSTDRGVTWKEDTLLLDTVYSAFVSLGMAITADGHFLGTFSPYAGSSIVVRGESHRAEVTSSPVYVLYNQYIYPNPSTGVVTISAVARLKPIGVYDMLGREVLRQIIPESGEIVLDLSSFPTGIYNILLYDFKRTIPLGKVVLVSN